MTTERRQDVGADRFAISAAVDRLFAWLRTRLAFERTLHIVFGAAVVLVLGHERCGAVEAAMAGEEVRGQISALYSLTTGLVTC